MVENLENQPLDSWEENWDACVFPLIRTFGRSTKSERRRTRHSSCSSGRPVEEAVMNNSKEDRDSGDEQDEQQAMVMMDLDGETR